MAEGDSEPDASRDACWSTILGRVTAHAGHARMGVGQDAGVSWVHRRATGCCRDVVSCCGMVFVMRVVVLSCAVVAAPLTDAWTRLVSTTLVACTPHVSEHASRTRRVQWIDSASRPCGRARSLLSMLTRCSCAGVAHPTVNMSLEKTPLLPHGVPRPTTATIAQRTCANAVETRHIEWAPCPDQVPVCTPPSWAPASAPPFHTSRTCPCTTPCLVCVAP